MNKFYTSNFKFRYLNSVINKILIKVSLNTTNKNNYPLSLSLLKEEIQKIIITYVTIEFNVLFYFLEMSWTKNRRVH